MLGLSTRTQKRPVAVGQMPRPVTFPSPAEVSEDFRAIYEKNQELGSRATALRREADEIRWLLNNEPAAPSLGADVAELLGELDDVVPTVVDRRARLVAIDSELRAIEKARVILADRLQAAKVSASATIRSQAAPAYADAARALCAALLSAIEADMSFRAIQDGLERSGAYWVGQSGFPMPSAEWRALAAQVVREIREAGLLDGADIPGWLADE